MGKVFLVLFLGVLAVIALVAGAGATFYFKVPQRLGLIKSPADTLLSGTPDREAAVTFKLELQKSGLNMTGIEVYVIPLEGTSSKLAVVVADGSRGFRIDESKGGDPVKDVLGTLGKAQAVGAQRVAVVYRDSTGRDTAVITLPTEVAAGYANGKITRRQLASKMELSADWLSLLGQPGKLVEDVLAKGVR